MQRKPIVAIDGPAGAGKSTTARKAAEILGFIYVDTGAMYRAVTLDVLGHDIDPVDEEDVCGMVRTTKVELTVKNGVQLTILNGKDVSARIREQDVTKAVSAVSAMGCVRERMTHLQREIGSSIRNAVAGSARGVVMEGRDIGTVVFPDAEYKFYLDATVEVRARRRFLELKEKGKTISYDDLIREIVERDRANTERELAPLKKAGDALLIDTSDMTFEEQVRMIVAIVNEV